MYFFKIFLRQDMKVIYQNYFELKLHETFLGMSIKCSMQM